MSVENIVSLAVLVLTLVVGHQLTKLLIAYRTERQKSQVEEALTQALDKNIKANEESDALKKIDGR